MLAGIDRSIFVVLEAANQTSESKRCVESTPVALLAFPAMNF